MPFPKNVRLETLSQAEIESLAQEDPKLFEGAAEKYNARIEGLYSRYAEKHPSFDKMWKEGTIEKFMAEHPGHTAISAHMTLIAQVPPRDEDPVLQKPGDHGTLTAIASRLQKGRQGTTQVTEMGAVLDDDQPVGSAPEEIQTVETDDILDADEPIDEPRDIHSLEDSDVVPEE